MYYYCSTPLSYKSRDGKGGKDPGKISGCTQELVQSWTNHGTLQTFDFCKQEVKVITSNFLLTS